MKVHIDSSWKEKLKEEFEKPYFAELTAFVKKEYKDEVVYPPPKYIFRAFDLCPFEKVKVVILGQDPYHGQRQANGLAFAVDEDITVPPSLQNIFKEIASDIDCRHLVSTTAVDTKCLQNNGDLSRWAEQGVLLLNATLTVRAHLAGSHQGRGWELFTDAAIRALSEECEHLVFMLWGNYAKAKGAHIDRSKHLVLEAPHPSPFSAYSGFFGCKHFSKANDYLIAYGETPIGWL
ncbi:uracil-DNA glycosylase [Candidatus Kaiserbacteria bacterium RIFOXYD1_FULL_47_14]|uniref:Uracil-DNA glycosylase n=1 Tax=Candidatus Kaiserbacteria bacterium RIFOXYD1_FULL_47_14 TaxID=1798533 RepID=A0A1F6G806_9BACT|nr:MAG: uracil-DNA glycosylase [Candidatus Kaiserbacteria bacterium RIFOXYD1_FULL_47_14]